MGPRLSKEPFKKHYKLGPKLGSGSFAEVFQAEKRSDHRVFAVKIIKKAKLSPQELGIIHDEVDIMHKISHKNCVKLYEMFENPRRLYMVMEVLTGGELFDRIVAKGSYSEAEAVKVVRSVADALKYLHRNGIVHRDLKPENLLLSDTTDEAKIKITDFGLAKWRVNARKGMNTACGTPGYVAPEVLTKGMTYGPEVDVWSLGVILYILLCGFPPFYHSKTGELYKLIKAGRVDFPADYWRDISPNAKDLVLRCLTVDPAKRITPAGILKHPWVAGGEAPTRDLGSAVSHNLRLLQARKQLRRTVQAVVAMNKFKSAIDRILAEGE